MPHKVFSLVFAAVILSFIAAVAIIQGHSAYAVVVFPDFNFGAVRDWGARNRDSTVKNMVEEEIQLNLQLQVAYSYQYPADCWLDIIQPIFNKTRISIGNNDVGNNDVIPGHFASTIYECL